MTKTKKTNGRATITVTIVICATAIILSAMVFMSKKSMTVRLKAPGTEISATNK